VVVVSVVVAGFVVVVSSVVVVVLVCAKANGATSAQIKPMIVLFTLPSLLMVSFTHKFVTHGVNGRSPSV
jgi:hypothetical protein